MKKHVGVFAAEIVLVRIIKYTFFVLFFVFISTSSTIEEKINNIDPNMNSSYHHLSTTFPLYILGQYSVGHFKSGSF